MLVGGGDELDHHLGRVVDDLDANGPWPMRPPDGEPGFGMNYGIGNQLSGHHLSSVAVSPRRRHHIADQPSRPSHVVNIWLERDLVPGHALWYLGTEGSQTSSTSMSGTPIASSSLGEKEKRRNGTVFS